MGLVTKTVKVKWNSANKKHYESLGYAYTKIGDEFEVDVNDLTKGSNVKVECSCDNCNKLLSWRYCKYLLYVKEERKTYCNKCATKLYGGENSRKTKLKNGKSFYDWCIENNRQDVLDRWDYELNDCSPKDVSYNTNKKMWLKCNKHSEHKSELKTIRNLTSGQEGSIECNQCNSIAQYILDSFPNKKLEEVWDYEKNGDLDPWSINRGSNNNKNKVWIICQEKDYHGSYETIPNQFSRGDRCPYCQGRKVHKKDSLGQYVVDKYEKEFLQIIWSDKNDISPFEISVHSNKKVWWNCPDNEHESFERYCNNSVRYDFRCPECVKEKEESTIEEKTRLYLEELGYKVKTEHNCTIRPINPKTKQPLPFDNEIVLKNGKHLIIEVHGEQHYILLNRSNTWLKKYRDKLTPEEYLHQRKLYDRYKRIKCIQAGYEYLEIPYTSFNKKETYKKLINNKIKNILDK